MQIPIKLLRPDWVFLNSFVALTNHSQLQTSLCEFNNRGLRVNPNESYADFERFDLTFEIQDAFLDRGASPIWWLC